MRLVPLVLLTALALGAHAAPPDAGTLMGGFRPAPVLPAGDTNALPQAQARPALKLDAGVKIAVKGVRIAGAHAFAEAELLPLVADAVGRELTLPQLQEVADRITAWYRERSYLLARAYLPAQDVKDGVVEIAVLEGRLGRLRVDNASSLADADVAGRLATLREGEAVEGAALERSLLLLNDLPGVEVRSTLKPGASVGTTDLDIRLTARPPYSGSVELDNYGNRYTGDLRLGAGLALASLAGLGDALSLRALTAQGMDYGRVAWQAPVGTAGTQAGAAYSDMRYELGKNFAALRAHGNARIASLYMLHPFRRSRSANLNGQLSYERKKLDDRVDSTATATRKTLDAWTLGLSGDRTDALGGGGITQWSATYTAGRLALDPATAIIDAAGHRTADGYDKANLAVSRLQNLGGDFMLNAGLQAQWAGKNLDSAEKLSLGGAQAVRAYPQGELPVDDGWLANIELRYRLAPNWQASVFHDAAQGRMNHAPIAADTHNLRRLSGFGLGLAWERPGDLSLRLALAWRDGPQPTSDVERTPRGWVQIVKRF